MPPALAPLLILLALDPFPGPGADDTALASVKRVSSPADAALVAAAVRSAGAAGVASRDDLAYRLLALGYSARETAEIVSGRLSKLEVDRAHARRLAGYPEPPPAVPPVTVSTTVPLIRPASLAVRLPQARVAVAPRTPVAPPVRALGASTPVATALRRGPARATPLPSLTPPSAVDAAIERYSRLHAVDPALVRAVIGEESGFRHAARSVDGAIGLMQLMPGTARHLGVNPYVMEQNLEGGIRYLAEQLRVFGRLELALVAYNAGPVVAERYARGEIPLYAETRGYLARILARYPR